jgi:error-prone DNA polymerase
MGFYAPAQIVRDAREHGVEVLPPDVNHSQWDSILEPGARAADHVHHLHGEMRGDIRTTHALRLGLREIKGLREEDAKLIVARRTCPGRSAAQSDALQTRDPASLESKLGPRSAVHRLRAAPHPGHESAPYDSARDVWLRTGLPPRVLVRLADADAFTSLGLTRRDALWAAKALGRVGDRDDDLPLFASSSPPPERGREKKVRGERHTSR